MRLWLGFAAVSGFIVFANASSAQVPVITSPSDLFLLDTNEAFDSTLNNGEGSWAQKAKMPTPRSHLAVCEVNHIIYAVGGVEALASSPAATSVVPIVEAYDPATNTWTTKSPMPEGRGEPACGTIDGILYVAGGFGPNTASTATLYAFDPAGNGGMGFWARKHDMPDARYGAGYGVIDGKLFVVGGSKSGTLVYDPAMADDPATGGWDTTRAAMLTQRGDLGAAVVNGILYAIGGGINNDVGYSAAVEAYDPATNTWTSKAPLPTARAEFGIGVFNNTIYAVGGLGFRHPIGYLFNDVEAFDPAANGGMGSWTQKTPMPTARSDFGGQFVDGIFYAIGGTVLGTAVVGQPFIYQVTATNYPTSYTADESGEANPFPPGLTLDPTSGLIYGVPTTAGRYREHLHATNTSGTGSSVFDIGVFPAPAAGGLTIVSSTCATGRTGQAFSFQALAIGGSAATHFSFGNLPDGLNGDAVTGVISGMPTSDGNFVVAITAIDGASETTGTLQLTFISDATVPIITSSDSVTLIPGQPLSPPYTITADVAGNFSYIGGDGQVHTMSGSAGLPQGLMYDAPTHTISGTYMPTANPFFVRSAVVPNTIRIVRPLIRSCQSIATNPSGTGTAPLNFYEATTGPIATQPPDVIAEATGSGGAAVSFTPPTVMDGNGNPLAVTCDPSPGSIFPLGTTTVTCTSSPDSFGAFGIVTFNVTIQDTTPPTITSIPTSITVGKQKAKKGQQQGATVDFASQLSAIDIVDGSVTPTATPSSGSFFGLGSTTVTVTATDKQGNTSAPQMFTVTVANKAAKAKPPTINLSVDHSTINEGQDATFTATASSPNPDGTITVGYQISGTATPAAQFYNLSAPQFVIPSGATQAKVTLHAIPNGLSSGSETAVMTIAKGSGYKLAKTPPMAIVTIDNIP
jgi:N-acetylneuraminic acid mutarotase